MAEKEVSYFGKKIDINCSFFFRTVKQLKIFLNFWWMVKSPWPSALMQ